MSISLYNKTASRYDIRQGNPWTQRLRQAEIDLIKTHARGKFLDIGCGTGFHLKWMEENQKEWTELTGCDLSAKMLEEARKQLSCRLVLGNAERLPFDNSGFDTVLCLNSVLNLCDHTKVLGEMHRVLKHGGKALLSVASIWDNNGNMEKIMSIEKEKIILKLFDKNVLKDIESIGLRVVSFDSLFRSTKPLWGNWSSQVVDDPKQPVERGAVWLLVLTKPENPS